MTWSGTSPRWSRHTASDAAARRELIAIAAYVSEASADPATGRGFAERLARHCTHLSSLSAEVRRARPDLGQTLRSSVRDGHIIVFRYDDRTGPRSHMIVVHILNGRRDLPKLFARLRNMH